MCVISRAVNLQRIRVETQCVAIKGFNFTEYEHGLAQTNREHMQACSLEFGVADSMINQILRLSRIRAALAARIREYWSFGQTTGE